MENQGLIFNYVDVILPLPLPGYFTYAVPAAMRGHLQPGVRVVVQFGNHKIFAALVYRCHNDAPEAYGVKPVLDVLDDFPVLAQRQLEFWKWISDYYLAAPGDIMAAALPVALRLQSETVILRDESFHGDQSVLNDREFLLYEALELQPELTLREVSKILNIKNVLPVIRNLILKGAIVAREEVEERVKPRIVEVIRLADKYLADEAELGELLNRLEKKAPRQADIIMAFLALTREGGLTEINKTLLLNRSGSPSSALAALVKQSVFTSEKRREDRVPEYNGPLLPASGLNPYQLQAILETRKSFDEGKVVLLHGVTSSGKTELYIHLIKDALDLGQQVLYLLPEIALTTQLIGRLQKHFGDRLLVYHSRFNEQERVEVWNKLLDHNLSGKAGGRLVVGARSAVLLPFDRLGLIIVDEEHDHSYKQVDPSPRYNARDAAIVLGMRQDARVLLGSATPSMESYFNALSGKYALVTLNKRHAELEMPSVDIVNMKEARSKKQVSGHFSHVLIDEISAVIKEKEQIILFQNRRGFAPSLECNLCAWTPRCVSCDVSLTYHKKNNELRCHYCGYVQSLPQKCGACGDQDLRMKGYGTERIEEDLQLIFPEARIARLDYDTTRSKSGFQRIISSFEEGEIDILVGTQMVTKGLDFDRVQLVGILNADSLLQYPEFRAHERAFQLLSQVSGRAGRKKKGRVLVQAYDVQNPVLNFVLQHDFRGFYMHELNERHRFSYPPYFRLIEVRLKHKDERKIDKLSLELAGKLRKVFLQRVLGPTAPTVTRVRNYFLRTIIIKVEKTLSMSEVKRMLSESLSAYRMLPENRNLVIQVDVDPI